MNMQIEDYGEISYDLHVVFSCYGLSETQKVAIIRIWEFLERCSLLMCKEFKGDISPMSINDLRMVDYGIKDTKDGKIKTVKSVREIPFRTVNFFTYNFTDVKHATGFFNPQNMASGIKWLIENILKPIGAFNSSDFIGEGLLSHKVACNSLPWHTDHNAKVEY